MSKSLVQSQFGANAQNYVTSKVHAKGASLGRLVELVQPQGTWTALDIATGAGHTGFAFAPHVAHVTASDITPQMLVEARQLAAEKSITNVTFAQADAEALPFPDASFDLVTCRIAPHHFPDVAAFVAEAARVLKPGGTFALVDNVSPDASTTPDFTVRELKDAAITYNAFEKIRDPSHGRALSAGEWRELITETGFDIVAEDLVPKAMDFEGWCQTMSVPADTVPKLSAMLHEASPALAAFIQPSMTDGKQGFVLTEAIFICRRQG